MKIKNKDNRHAKTYDLSRMQDCDNCCSSWPSRDGVVDFRGEKIYFIEYQDLTKPKDVREVRVMGFSVKFNPQEVREYILYDAMHEYQQAHVNQL